MVEEKKNILVCIPEVTHRELAAYELEGLMHLGFNIKTTLYGGLSGKNYLLRIFIIFKNAFSIVKIVRKEKIDLVYINTAFNFYGLLRDFISLFIMRSVSSKIFLKTHGSDAPLLKTSNIILIYMIRKYSQWADGFGVLSTDEYLNFINAGFNPQKVFVIKNIVNPSVYLKNSIFHEKYSINDCAILLFVARLIPQKGLLETIKAAIILKKKSFNFRLIVLGDGPDKIIAEKMVDEANISSSVYFAGFLPEEQTKEFYANSDLLVFPTYHEEGFPMAVFQSVAAGLPIITTKIRASADYLKEPDNCLWVEPRNPEMLAERIEYLLKNPDVSFQMSGNNKKLSNLFTQEVVCKELELDFDTIMKK